MPRTKGSWTKENAPKSPGRPPKSPEQKAKEKAERESLRAANFDFKAECARLLPLSMTRMEQVLRSGNPKNKAWAPVYLRIGEFLADRNYGRPAQAITGANGGPLAVSFSQILGAIDGSKGEKFEGTAEAAKVAEVLKEPESTPGNERL